MIAYRKLIDKHKTVITEKEESPCLCDISDMIFGRNIVQKSLKRIRTAVWGVFHEILEQISWWLFVPWTRSLKDLNHLHYYLNSLHPSINFTIEYSQKELPFLDVLVKKTGTSINTDIYFKQTDSQQYLISDSCKYYLNPAVKFLDLIFRNNFFIINISKMCSR